MSDLGSTGFDSPDHHRPRDERGSGAFAQLLASVALLLCTIVAAGVVSVGIARADIAGRVIDNEGSLFMLSLALGLIFIAIGGFSLLPNRRRHY